jgi:hypothetical protein
VEMYLGSRQATDRSSGPCMITFVQNFGRPVPFADLSAVTIRSLVEICRVHTMPE